MSSTSSDKIRWTKPLVFLNLQLNTGEWTIILFLPLLWLEMSTSGHTTQFSQPQVNPTRRWDRGNPTRPPTLSMLRGQRMEQRFTWDKHSTIEISHADYIFLYIMYHFHWQYNITYSIHKCIILGTVVCFKQELCHYRFRAQTASASSTSACFLPGIRTLSIFRPDNDKNDKNDNSPNLKGPSAVPTFTFCWCFFLISFPEFLSIWVLRWADCLVMFLSQTVWLEEVRWGEWRLAGWF